MLFLYRNIGTNFSCYDFSVNIEFQIIIIIFYNPMVKRKKIMIEPFIQIQHNASSMEQADLHGANSPLRTSWRKGEGKRGKQS